MTARIPIIDLAYRILAFLLFCSLFCISTQQGYAQSSTLLDREVNYGCSDCSLQTVLFELKDLFQLNFSYSNGQIANQPKVQLSPKNRRLNVLLDEILLASTLDYQATDYQIIIYNNPNKVFPTLSIGGYLLDSLSGEALVGGYVLHAPTNRATTTNGYGYFSIKIPVHQLELDFFYLGYSTKTIAADRLKTIASEQKIINVRLNPSIQLKEIVISSSVDNLQLAAPGANSITKARLQATLSPGGEPDAIRVIQNTAGVQSGADGFGGLSVQGGNIDQNLFLLDDVPIYDATHAVGIYSVFNSEAVRTATLWKGVLPARYGGRLSSVVEVRTREGNLREFSGGAETGITSGSAFVEGPLIKNKAAFFVSYRRSYLDFFSKPISREQRKRDGIRGEFGYYFSDFNFKFNMALDDRNRLFFSYYDGTDQFNDSQVQNFIVSPDTTVVTDRQQAVSWGNRVAALRWNHLLTKQLFVNTVATFSRFGYNTRNDFSFTQFVNSQPNDQNLLLSRFDSNNEDFALKTDWDWFINSEHRLRWGVGTTLHSFVPGVNTIDENSPINIESPNRTAQNTVESNAYLDEEWRPHQNLLINAGLRLSSLVGTDYDYFRFEPRLTATLQLDQRFSVNAAAGRHVQMLHLLTSSGVGLPRDLWLAAGDQVTPSSAVLFTTGFNYVHPNERLRIQLNGYYKRMENLVLLQEGLIGEITSENWQNKVNTGSGTAYGVELTGEFRTNNWASWWSYTYGKSTRLFGNSVNSGNPFPDRLDRRHNANFTCRRSLKKDWTIGGSYTFASGSAYSFPNSLFEFNQLNQTFSGVFTFPFILEVINYGETNSYRLPAFHHLDFNLQKVWKKERFEHNLSLGVYNAYNRQNPLYYTLRQTQNENGAIQQSFFQVTLFPTFPFLRYGVKW